MKKLRLFLTGILAAAVAVGGVNAAEVKNAKELNACVNAFDECKLTADIVEDGETLDEEAGLLEIDNNVVIDLNGHTLTLKENVSEIPGDIVGAEIMLNSGNVTIKNGNIVQESKGDVAAINIYGGATLNTENLNISVTSAVGGAQGKKIPSAITLSGDSAKSVATLNVSADTIVNVTNGYGIIISTFSTANMNGTWASPKSLITIKNADLKNCTNKEIKSTNVTFNGGKYTTDDITVDIKNGTWTFNGGSFTSKLNDAIHIANIPNNQNSKKVENGIVVTMNGGMFETKSDSHKPLHSDELTKFVYGGLYKAPVVNYELRPEYVADTVKTVVENDVTYVGNEYTIAVIESTNGTVEADKAKAIPGQVVTLTALAEDDYVLDTFTVTDEKGNAIEVVDGKFVMPDSNVTVKATFKSVIAESTKITTEIPSADDAVTTDEKTSNVLTETLKNTKDADLKKLLEKNDVTVALEAKDTTLTNDEMKKFADVLPNATISKYLDISVLVKAGETTRKLHELDEEITLTVKIPDNLPELKDGYTRVYYILREHDGKVERLETVLSKDGTELSFATNKFSTYALAYEDQANAGTNPDTGDSIGSYLMISAIACTGLLALGYSIKKKLEN